MEKQVLVMELINDLISLSDEKYQEAKDYWMENSPSEGLIAFLQILFTCTDMKRAGGIKNADA